MIRPVRLQNADGPWGEKTFFYDGAGNRTSETIGGVTDTYSYPSTSNKL